MKTKQELINEWFEEFINSIEKDNHTEDVDVFVSLN